MVCSGPVLYVHENRTAGAVLQPDWQAVSPSTGTRILCFTPNMLRASPWPKSGGFCYFEGIRADPKSQAIMLPSDFQLKTHHPNLDSEAQRSLPWRSILGRVDMGNGVAMSATRGGMRFINVSVNDPRLCDNRQRVKDNPPKMRVQLTPLGDPKSLPHWSVAMFAAFSLQLHLSNDFGLPSLTHVFANDHGKGSYDWVTFLRETLSKSAGLTVLDTPLHIAGHDKWSQLRECFDGTVVGIGAGYSYDPLWFLAPTDVLQLRRVLAQALIKKGVLGDDSGGLQGIAKRKMSAAIAALVDRDPVELHVHVMNRVKRSIGNVAELADAIRFSSSNPMLRKCVSGFSGECDLSWRATVETTNMEQLSAVQQISSYVGASSPNIFIVPHGAGTTHVSYLEPCSVVIEVVPYNYPQYSFMMPTLRSGSFMLYMVESTALGNPSLHCPRPFRNNASYPYPFTHFVPASCLKESACKRTARGNPTLHADPELVLQLIHRGAYLRRRCLAHFPNIEFLPNELGERDMLSESSWLTSFRSAKGEARSSGSLLDPSNVRAWRRYITGSPPLVSAWQHAPQLHYEWPTVATGVGVSEADAARSLVQYGKECIRPEAGIPKGFSIPGQTLDKGHAGCGYRELGRAALLAGYASLHRSLPPSCSALCKQQLTEPNRMDQCERCLHRAAVVELWTRTGHALNSQKGTCPSLTKYYLSLLNNTENTLDEMEALNKRVYRRGAAVPYAHSFTLV